MSRQTGDMTVMTVEKEFMTFEEAASYVGIKRSSLYNYLDQLGIGSQKFRLDKRKYLALADVKRIKEVREKPWLAGPAHDEEK